MKLLSISSSRADMSIFRPIWQALKEDGTVDHHILLTGMHQAQANADFGAYAVNWLLDRSMLLADIAPRPYREYSLSMTASDRTVLRWIFLAGLPGAALGVGFLVWLRRRS